MNIYFDSENRSFGQRDAEGNEYYYGINDGFEDMMKPISSCRRFERRHDFGMFNMSDYMSCENCRHLSADNRCVAELPQKP